MPHPSSVHSVEFSGSRVQLLRPHNGDPAIVGVGLVGEAGDCLEVEVAILVGELGRGCTSWTAVLDAARLEPGADVTAVTTVQIREVIERLAAAGQWQPGDPEVLVVLDAGYDAPRIAHLLRDLPVQALGQLRSDRVMQRPTPPRVYDPKGGRPCPTRSAWSGQVSGELRARRRQHRPDARILRRAHSVSRIAGCRQLPGALRGVPSLAPRPDAQARSAEIEMGSRLIDTDGRPRHGHRAVSMPKHGALAAARPAILSTAARAASNSARRSSPHWRGSTTG